MSAALACPEVTKRFGATIAVDRVDLAVAAGEVVALLGPSGCGKTTLLRLIAGFEEPDGGSITLDRRELVSERTVLPPERRGVAVVFQDFALFPHMTVGANIAFGVPRGRDKAAREVRVRELLELAGLSGLGARMPHELSGGQQQRVALVRALAAEPALVLLDEPFSNLDPLVRRRVRTEVKQLVQAVGITAVFVTHDQEEALSLAERIAVMIDGRIRQTGTPAEVYGQPQDRAVAEFLGDANFLVGAVRGARVECELGTLPVRADFEGRAEILVRAEQIEVDPAGATASVVGVEYYGHDQLAHVRTARSGLPLRVRLPADVALRPGDTVGLAVRGDVLAFPER